MVLDELQLSSLPRKVLLNVTFLANHSRRGGSFMQVDVILLTTAKMEAKHIMPQTRFIQCMIVFLS